MLPSRSMTKTVRRSTFFRPDGLVHSRPYFSPNSRLKSLSRTRSSGRPSWARQASCAQVESTLIPKTWAPSWRNSSIFFPNSESSLVQPGLKSNT